MALTATQRKTFTNARAAMTKVNAALAGKHIPAATRTAFGAIRDEYIKMNGWLGADAPAVKAPAKPAKSKGAGKS